MSMSCTEETPRRVPLMKRSPLANFSQPTFHDRAVYPHWVGSPALTITHHPVDPSDFYRGPELKIDLDVSQFRQEDLSVELSGNSLIIEGTHEARYEDKCTVERRFVRKFELPVHMHHGSVTSKLSRTGVLRITVSK